LLGTLTSGFVAAAAGLGRSGFSGSHNLRKSSGFGSGDNLGRPSRLSFCRTARFGFVGPACFDRLVCLGPARQDISIIGYENTAD
jgi:hypothetical protein